MSLALWLRKKAWELQQETGKSVKETLQEIVSRARRGIVPYEKGSVHCIFCDGSDVPIQSVEKKGPCKTIRNHHCRFCGASFQSEEAILPEIKAEVAPVEPPKTVAKKKKKNQSKKRGKKKT